MLLFHTLRHLEGRQVWGQVKYRLRSRLERTDSFLRGEVPKYPGCRWPQGVRFLAPGDQQCHAQVRNGIFDFINRCETIGFPPDWTCSGLPKLWQYNLHYFEWLWSLEYEDARKVILDWMQGHPLQKGNVGWEPFPISLRVVNWCVVFWGRFRRQIEQDSEFSLQLWRSVWCQCEWLIRNLETHLLGNHYFVNGASLAFVGSCFAGDAAKRWLDTGCKILEEQIPEQVLQDGMHFELSPMYHSMVVYSLGMLAATGNTRLRNLVVEPLKRMKRILPSVCHPDGRIALLGDSAFGIYSEPKELISSIGQVLGEKADTETDSFGCFGLKDAGYYGWHGRDDTYLICHFGKIGPDYIPGHAHADMFSFEMSLRGHRVIVDSGVHDYEVSQMRQYCRSTVAHNTVEINGVDQSEMWGAFRVARRGYPHDVKWEPRKTGFHLSGWHDGYQRLPGKPRHHRVIEWEQTSGVTIRDTVTATRDVEVVARLHLHPDCMIENTAETEVAIESPGGSFQIVCDTPGKFHTEDSWYCPEFNQKIGNKAICLSARGRNITLGYRICGTV